jgi:hypothetical protein
MKQNKITSYPPYKSIAVVGTLSSLVILGVVIVQEGQIDRYYGEDASRVANAVKNKCGFEEPLPVEFDLEIGILYNHRYGQLYAMGHTDVESIRGWLHKFVDLHEPEVVTYSPEKARQTPNPAGNYDGKFYEAGVPYYIYTIAHLCLTRQSHTLHLEIRSSDGLTAISVYDFGLAPQDMHLKN